MASWARKLPSLKWPTTQRAWAVGGVGAAIGASAVFWLMMTQTPGESAWLPPCMFHAATGLFCPGCGITRAIHALVHGDIARAFSMNAFAMIGMMAMFTEIIDRMSGQPAWWSGVRRLLHDARTWATIVIIFVIGRNLPWYPFYTWAPG